MTGPSGPNAPPAGAGTAPRPGLRARKKTATMHRVQQVALDLFTREGFDSVSIEQVADAAEVSPSTIYRYFGTKEGLVIHDEYEDRLLDALRRSLDQGGDFWASADSALAAIWEEHFVTDGLTTRARMRLWFEVPSIRAAGYLATAEQVDELARVMADTGRWTFPRARVIASGVVWPLMAAMCNWYDAGLDTDWRDHVTDVLAWLKRTYTAQATGPA